MNHVFLLLPILFLIGIGTSFGYAQEVSFEDNILKKYERHSFVSYDINELNAINQKINNHMYDTIENYNADRWGDIIEHPNAKGLFILQINEDSRNPISGLDTDDKIKSHVVDLENWKKDLNPIGLTKE